MPAVERALVGRQHLFGEVVGEAGAEGDDHHADDDLVGAVAQREEGEQPPEEAPAPAPASTPSQRLPVACPIIAPRKAPARNWPSMAMLMTPDRSHMIPDSEPYTSGVVADQRPGEQARRS